MLKSKIIQALMVIASVCLVSAITSCGSSKGVTKSVSTRAKQLEKDGFRSTNPLYSIEEQLEACRAKTLSNPNLIMLTQQASGVSEFAAETAVQNGVAVSYANKTASILKGKLERDMGKLDNNNMWDAYRGSYTQDLPQMVGPIMQEGIKLIRQDANGVTVWMLFFLDEAKAQEIRNAASEKALRIQKSADEFSKSVRRHVNEPTGSLDLDQ